MARNLLYSIASVLSAVAALAPRPAIASTHVDLNQGPIVGLKIFPESSRSAVYSFLGVPYAEPPLNDLRFAIPRPHAGWNRTLFARDMRPLCPQLSSSVYEETPERTRIYGPIMDEDCLYLNVWAPEAAFQQRSHPVLVIITGEEMSFDWSLNRPTGLDLSSEGMVVVTVQYRTNVFGWLGANSKRLPGNYGLRDQELALRWVQDNIGKFGGNSKEVTLLGHGTSGVSCALIHLASAKSQALFSKMVLMSGSPKFYEPTRDQSTSMKIIEKLGCHYEKPLIVECLRSKSMSDLQKAFESVYSYSTVLGPVLDDFYPIMQRYVPKSATEILKSGKIRKIPILMGIGSNEGAFLRDYWVDLARDSHSALQGYISQTVIPKIFHKYFPSNSNYATVLKAMNWKYFDSLPKTPSHLLAGLQRLVSEAEFEAPFYDLLELLSTGNSTLFAYSLEMSRSMDMRGKVNLFGGISHSSDLPLLMGPSLFQQIARRRFSPIEDKMCRQMRSAFAEFVKSGNPTPGRLYDAWLSYTKDRKFIKILGDVDGKASQSLTAFEENLQDIEQLLEGNSVAKSNQRNAVNAYQIANNDLSRDGRRNKPSYLTNQRDYQYHTHLKEVNAFWNVLLQSIASSAHNTSKSSINHEIHLLQASTDATKYKNAFISMLAVVCMLLAVLAVCVYLLRKHHPSLSANL